MRPRSGPVQVVVVDDDDISRRGMASLLGECPEIEVVTALSHADALACDDIWSRADVVLVDAADRRLEGDQFPGVGVVQRIRRSRAREEVVVVVVTGHFFNDAIRRRMREAKADFFYHRSELADARLLYEAVLDPDPGRDVPEAADPEDEFRQGVVEGTRVNEAVAYASEHHLERALSTAGERPRRALQRLRREFDRIARLHSVTTDGRAPERAQAHPSLRQIARFLAWATKVRSERPDERR